MLAHITRRGFLAFGGLAAAASSAAAAPVPKMEPVRLLRCPVAGHAYYDYPRLAGVLAVGDPLALRRQPTNPHDRRAIEVFTGSGSKLGYVPRINNPAITGLMDAGYRLRAEIVDVHGSDWSPVWMRVSLIAHPGH